MNLSGFQSVPQFLIFPNSLSCIESHTWFDSPLLEFPDEVVGLQSRLGKQFHTQDVFSSSTLNFKSIPSMIQNSVRPQCKMQSGQIVGVVKRSFQTMWMRMWHPKNHNIWSRRPFLEMPHWFGLVASILTLVNFKKLILLLFDMCPLDCRNVWSLSIFKRFHPNCPLSLPLAGSPQTSVRPYRSYSKFNSPK